MTTYSNTMPSGVAMHLRPAVPFKDTQEAKERRETRRTIRMAKRLSRNERDTLLYLVNLWFVHRRKDGFIHPGAEKIAAKVALSIRSVKTFLSRFRQMGFLKAIAFAKGGRKATRYTVDFSVMQEALDPHGVEHRPGELAELPSVEIAPETRPSSPETGSDENVKTVQNLHTVITSARCIDAANDDHCKSAGIHPAFLGLDRLLSSLAKSDNEDFESHSERESPFLAWMMGEAA